MGTSSTSSNKIISVTGYTGTGKMTFQISYYEQSSNWLSAYTTCQTRGQGELLRIFNITLIADVFRSNNIDITTEIWTSIIYPINRDGGARSWFDAYSCEDYLGLQQSNYTTDTCLSMTVGESSAARLCTDNRSFACVLSAEPFLYHVGMDVSPESASLFLVDQKIVTANECLEFCVNREACIAFTAYTNASNCTMYSLTNITKKLIEYNITNGHQSATHAIKNQNTFNVKPDMPLPASLTYPSCPQSGAISVAKTVLPLDSSTEMNTLTVKPAPGEHTASTSVQSTSVYTFSQAYITDNSLRYSYLITISSSVFLETNSLLGQGLTDSTSTNDFSGSMYSSLSPSYVITANADTLHAHYSTYASLHASQQLSLTHEMIEYSLSTIATTFVPESSYDYLKTLGTKCSCQCTEKSLVSLAITEQQIKENIEKIKEELHIDRKSTNTYIRGLISADDKRISAQTIGASAVVILIGLLLAVVILDLNNFYQSGLMFLDNVRDLFPRNQP
ncbi:hypothetical protein CHS0354_033478 [Potamilus streckersoni]|uniref:Apple domain-containing protein n=1 Tax=Potamilus streckersoni TaxID=2493646 RepID=A0AAE0VKD9_9BIVA|nr:hypothetical protein CHS0354_033478 [Potamilus streckersoni]